MKECTRYWDGWEITAGRDTCDAPLTLRAECDGRTIIFDRQYRRVLADGDWRDPDAIELAVIDSAATTEAINALLADECEARDEAEAGELTRTVPACTFHAHREAQHYSQAGQRICAECYAEDA